MINSIHPLPALRWKPASRYEPATTGSLSRREPRGTRARAGTSTVFCIELRGTGGTHPASPSEEELARIEAFTSRFARVVDLMSKRVLRAIDAFEMYEPGTLLDVANRAEKRGVIESVEWLRELKDTRNRISHDYAGDLLPEVLAYCRAELPRLSAACERIATYGNALLARSGGFEQV